MKTKSFKQSLYIILFLLSISLASALTIPQLIDSYDYSLNKGITSITNSSDTMIDSNNDSVNDTLQLTLNTTGSAGTYLFFVDLEDNNKTISSNLNKTISTNDSLTINFSTTLLQTKKFNYTVRIYNLSDELIYRNNKTETQLYGYFQNGTSILSITDQNINNNYIRINLSLNNTQNLTTNVTVVLTYNQSTINTVSENNITQGLQIISIDVNNEIIKSTHYNGKFSINKVAIGDQIFNLDYNTSSYNYELFAATNYINGVTLGLYDNNSNNLSELLQVNVSLRILEEGNFSINLMLNDNFGNYIANTTVPQRYLIADNYELTANFSGEEIYKSRLNGPYVISVAAIIKDNTTQDIVYDTNKSANYIYSNFEAPERSDLIIDIINISYTGELTKVLLNISNKGTAPAFNVFVDLFDNNTFSYNQSISLINVSQSYLIEANNSNTTEYLIYYGFVDLDNFIDEENETNNLDIYPSISFKGTAATPNPIGFGQNVTIGSIIMSDNKIHNAYVNIIQPNGVDANYTMTNLSNSWSFNFSSYLNGTYNYTIYANDTSGLINLVSGNFQIHANFFIIVKAINDTYFENQLVKLSNTTVNEDSLQKIIITNFTNGKSKEHLAFTTNQSLIRYLKIKKISNITSAYVTLTGRNITDLPQFVNDDQNVYSNTTYNVNFSLNIENKSVQRLFTAERSAPYTCSGLCGATCGFDEFIKINDQYICGIGNDCEPLGQGFCTQSNFSLDNASINNGINNISIYQSIGCCELHTTFDQIIADDFASYIYNQNKSVSPPINTYLDIGNDATQEWNLTGEFFGSNITNNLSSAITNYLSSCTADSNGFCLVPFVFFSNSTGVLEYSNINIIYYINSNLSRIENVGSTNSSYYLLMKVQFFNVSSEQWEEQAIILNETSPRTLYPLHYLQLDPLWNQNAWNTSNNLVGTYRVYIAATDENNVVLKNKNGSEIVATYNFTIISLTPPTHDTPILNATDNPRNSTFANLTVYNQSTSDSAKNIIDWKLNSNSIALVNLPFEDNNGSAVTIAKDYSSYNNNGTVIGAVFSATAGYDERGAYLFDGNGDYIKLNGTSLNNLTQNITFSVWIYSASNDYAMIYGGYNNTNPWEGIGILKDKTSGGICSGDATKVGYWRGGAAWLCSATGLLQLNTWTHLVILHNSTGVTFYKNGVIFGSTISAGVASAYAGSKSIGAMADASGNFFNGTIDEFKIYNRALSAEQIKAIYDNRTDLIVSQETEVGDIWVVSVTPNNGILDGITLISNNLTIRPDQTSPTQTTPILNATDHPLNLTTVNLTVYNQSTYDIDKDSVKNSIDWRVNISSIAVLNMPFEENGSSSTVVKDYSTYNNDAVVTNAVFSAVAGYDNKGAYHFDGNGDYLDVGALDSSLNDSAFTVEAWIRAVNQTSSYAGIVGSEVGTPRTGFAFTLGNNGQLYIWTAGDTWDGSNFASRIDDNQWHHVAVTINKSGTLFFYKDGVKDGPYTSWLFNVSSVGYIGARFYSYVQEYFNGTIDEVKIYNRALSDEQIRANYNNKTNIIVSQETQKNDIWNVAVTPNDGKNDGNTLLSNNVTIINSAPLQPTLLIPQNNSHTNDNTTTFSWTTTDPDNDQISSYELIISNTTAFTQIIINKTVSIANYTLNQTEELNDGTYYWSVKACDTEKCSNYSEYFNFTIDTINPFIEWYIPKTDNTSIINEQNITWDVKISDSNLYNVLMNVTNASNSLFYTEYIQNITGSTYNFSNTTDLTSWKKGNYTVEVSAGDDHTYGSLHGLDYTIQNDGITFGDGLVNKKIYVGYYRDGTFNLLTTQEIQNHNISFSVKEINKEYKWNMSFKRPQNDLQFGFAIPVDSLILRNKDKGHFVWDKWYIDFEDLVNNNFEINVINKKINGINYWIVYTSTAYCNTPKGTTCILDPTVGGLNIVTEYKSIFVNKKPTQTTPILNATDNPNNTTNGNLTVYNQSTNDNDGDSVKNIINWKLNSTSISVLNMPFEGNLNDSSHVADYSLIYSNTATVTNAVFNNNIGYDNKGAYQFDGNGDYINIGALDDSLNDSAFTVEAWIKAGNQTSSYAGIVGTDLGSPRTGFAFTLANNGQLYLWTAGDTWDSSNFATRIDDNQWHHVAATVDNSKMLYFYKDGIKNGPYNSGLFNISSVGYIGARYYNDIQQFFNGTIDEVKIYNRALSEEQIRANYNNKTDIIVSNELKIGDIWSAVVTTNDGISDGNSKESNNLTIYAGQTAPTHDNPILNATDHPTNSTNANLTVYNQSTDDIDVDYVKNIIDWRVNSSSIAVLNTPFEENGFAVSNVKDYSTFSNNGIVTNAVFNKSGGYDGKGAYHFDGNGDYLDVGALDSSLNDSAFTVEAWIRAVNQTSSYAGIVGSEVGTPRTGFAFTLANNGQLYIWTAGDTWDGSNFASRIDDNQWHHIAATVDSSKMLYFYKDSIKDGPYSSGLFNVSTICYIGARYYSGIQEYFNGTIDEVKIYNRALSEEQIRANYNNRTDLIVSQETEVGNIWTAAITPNDGSLDGLTKESNSVAIT
ncbi:hypothetical protein J4232_01615 [Candidatus Woesearchaeota archaeon]|nr:hypothetical protein [Candidatus Woesearchaeota archaeon]